jgi:hypothetical protein
MLGASNAELWNNLGLCCFYASQYDMTLRCFENALQVADDMAQADIWCVLIRNTVISKRPSKHVCSLQV